MNKIKTLTLGSLLLSLTGVASAGVVPIGEQIINGTFNTDLSSWTPAGAAANWRAVGDTLNTSTGNAGFNSFFTSGFAALGANVGTNIAGNPSAGISSISQSFTLPAVQGSLPVTGYELTISFQTVFDGDKAVNATDFFFATLNGIPFSPQYPQNSNPLPNCGPAPAPTCANNQWVNNPFTSTISGLLPGTYTLTFTLNEATTSGTNTTTNTAAGIDTVSITGRALTEDPDVDDIPEPSILLLFGGGLLALRLVRKPA